MKNKQKKIRTLVLPADNVFPSGKIKKEAIFFDQVVLPDPQDKYLIEYGEMKDDYPDMTIWQSERAPYIREDDYEDKFYQKIKGAWKLRKKGILRVLDKKDWRSIDPWFRLILYHSAITDSHLVRAAIPDAHDNKEINVPDGVITGGDIRKKGWKKVPEIRSGKPYYVTTVDNAWNQIAYLRIARFLKYLQVAQLLNAAPSAKDIPNNNILLSCGQSMFTEIPDPEKLTTLSMSLDIVDNEEIENILEDAPWDDIIKIRKEILPLIANYRSMVINKAKNIQNSNYTDFEQYREVVKKDVHDLYNAKEEVYNSWRSLGIIGTLKGVATSTTTSMAGLMIPATGFQLIGTILTGVALGGGILSKELRDLILAKNKLSNNPLFIIDRNITKQFKR